MKDRKLAIRYARALLSAIPDRETARKVDDFLYALGGEMTVSAEFRELLLDPAVPRDDRVRLLTTLSGRFEMPGEVSRFLETVVDNRRVAVLPQIAEMFRALREEAAGIVPATMTTARPLSDELQEKARSALESMTGKEVKLTCDVEPGLLGGAVTRIGSTIYDGSLRTQLAVLRRKMVEE